MTDSFNLMIGNLPLEDESGRRKAEERRREEAKVNSSESVAARGFVELYKGPNGWIESPLSPEAAMNMVTSNPCLERYRPVAEALMKRRRGY